MIQSKNLKLKLGLCGLALTSFLALNSRANTVHADTVSGNNADAITWDADNDDSQVVHEDSQHVQSQVKAVQSAPSQRAIQSDVQAKQSQPKMAVSNVSSTVSIPNRAERNIVRQSNAQTNVVNRLNAQNNLRVANVQSSSQMPVQAQVVGQWDKGSKIYGIYGDTVGTTVTEWKNFNLVADGMKDSNQDKEPMFKIQGATVGLSGVPPIVTGKGYTVYNKSRINRRSFVEDQINAMLVQAGLGGTFKAVIPTWYDTDNSKFGYDEATKTVTFWLMLQKVTRDNLYDNTKYWPVSMQDKFFSNGDHYVAYDTNAKNLENYIKGDRLPAVFECSVVDSTDMLNDQTSYIVDTGHVYNGKQVGMLVIPKYSNVTNGSYKLYTVADGGIGGYWSDITTQIKPRDAFTDSVLPNVSKFPHKDDDIQNIATGTTGDFTLTGWEYHNPDGSVAAVLYGGGGPNHDIYEDVNTGGPATVGTVNTWANGYYSTPTYNTNSGSWTEKTVYKQVQQPSASYDYTVVPVDLKTGDVINGLALQGTDTKNGKISADASLVTPQIKQDILNLNKYTPNYVGTKANDGVQMVEALQRINPQDSSVNRTAKRVIHITFPNNIRPKSYDSITDSVGNKLTLDSNNNLTQSMSFTRDGVKNLATGQVTYGNWQQHGAINAVTLPSIPGYTMVTTN